MFNFSLSPQENTFLDSDINTALFNAVSLTADAIKTTIMADLDPSDGKAVVLSTRNASFDGAESEVIRTDENGDIIHYFYLLDFHPRSNQLVSVLESRPSAPDWGDVLEPGSDILWPNGRRLAPDTCDFELCEDGGRCGSFVETRCPKKHKLLSNTSQGFRQP